MNYNYSTLTILLSMFAFASLNADYVSIHTVIDEHTAILKKWAPALNNLSPDSLKAVIKEVKAVLKAKENDSSFKSEENETKALIRDLEAWPFMFACQELDRDIQILSARIDKARMFNVEYAIDMSSLRNLRAQIDSLACIQRERQEHASFVKHFAACMVGLGVACTTYIWCQPWQLKA